MAGIVRRAPGPALVAALVAALLLLNPLSAALADEVHLVTGEVLKGDVTEESLDEVVLIHESLGEVRIPSNAVKKIVTLPPSPLANKLEGGFGGSQGNAETFDVRAAFSSDYKTSRMALALGAAYYYGSVDDSINRHKYYVETLDQLLVPESSLSFFVQGRYDWDREADWEGRVAWSLGMGHRFIDRPELDATIRSGIGFIREYGTDEDEIMTEVPASIELNWRPGAGALVELDSTYYLNVSDPGEYRVLTAFSASHELGIARGFRISLSAEDEYQSTVDEGFEYNDFRYYGSLAVAF